MGKLLEKARQALATRGAVLVPGRCYEVNEVNEVRRRPAPQDSRPEQGQGYELDEVNEQSSAPRASYILITTAADVDMVAGAVEDSALVGLDVETTGLDVRRDRVRLLSLAVQRDDDDAFVYLLDLDAIPHGALNPIWEALVGVTVIGHNLGFDVGMLAPLGFVPGTVRDTMLMSQTLHAGHLNNKHGLAACVERELGRSLDKTMQKADWSGALTADHLRYAAEDARVLLDLHAALAKKIAEATLDEPVGIEHACLLGLTWLRGQGVPFDRAAWTALGEKAEAEVKILENLLDDAAPPREGTIPGIRTWNWCSPEQVAEALAGAGCQVKDTADETLATIDHPLGELVRQHRAATKRSTTYGRDWMKHVDDDDRVRSDWQQMGARTGRMSSRDPNLQNIPRDVAFRRCFRAPPGYVLIKADYSQIELRVAARVANERRMIDAYARGDDLHTLTARQITGKAEVTKAERQLAKPVNFGLIYGCSAKRLRQTAAIDYGVTLTVEEAERYRNAFFKAWPGIDRWHSQLRRDRSTETRTLSGRRVIIPADTWHGRRANFIVQGSAGDGIKLALGLMWTRRAELPPCIAPVAVIHDELLVLAPQEHAAAARDWVTRCMVDAMTPMLAPIPVEVEAKVSQTWGGDQAP